MQTPWGDIPVSDAHVHFFSHRFLAALAAQAATSVAALGPRLGWELPPEDAGRLAELWAAELDRQGVERAALIGSMPGDEDSVAAAVERLPGRFHGYSMLNPVAPDGLDRARRAIEGGRIRGLCLFPAMHRYSIQDPRLRPLFELIAGHPGTLLFVHCGVLTVGVRKKLGLPSPFDMRYSNPIDLHAVALEYPSVPLVVPHFGAGYFREALMLCDLCPNVYLDTSSSNGWLRYQPAQVDLKCVFRRALDVAGASRLLFGTDSSFFPRGWHAEIFQQQIAVLYALGISEGEARNILGGNLNRLLRA